MLTGKLKELWKPPEAITMEMVGGKDQNVRLRRRAGESKGLSTKLGQRHASEFSKHKYGLEIVLQKF